MITVFHKSITFASPRNLRTCRQNRLGILRPQFSFFGAVPDAVVLGRLVTELLSTRRYYLVAVREGYIVVASCESVLAAHATALVGDAVPI